MSSGGESEAADSDSLIDIVFALPPIPCGSQCVARKALGDISSLLGLDDVDPSNPAIDVLVNAVELIAAAPRSTNSFHEHGKTFEDDLPPTEERIMAASFDDDEEADKPPKPNMFDTFEAGALERKNSELEKMNEDLIKESNERKDKMLRLQDENDNLQVQLYAATAGSETKDSRLAAEREKVTQLTEQLETLEESHRKKCDGFISYLTELRRCLLDMASPLTSSPVSIISEGLMAAAGSGHAIQLSSNSVPVVSNGLSDSSIYGSTGVAVVGDGENARLQSEGEEETCFRRSDSNISEDLLNLQADIKKRAVEIRGNLEKLQTERKRLLDALDAHAEVQSDVLKLRSDLTATKNYLDQEKVTSQALEKAKIELEKALAKQETRFADDLTTLLNKVPSDLKVQQTRLQPSDQAATGNLFEALSAALAGLLTARTSTKHPAMRTRQRLNNISLMYSRQLRDVRQRLKKSQKHLVRVVLDNDAQLSEQAKSAAQFWEEFEKEFKKLSKQIMDSIRATVEEKGWTKDSRFMRFLKADIVQLFSAAKSSSATAAKRAEACVAPFDSLAKLLIGSLQSYAEAAADRKKKKKGKQLNAPSPFTVPEDGEEGKAEAESPDEKVTKVEKRCTELRDAVRDGKKALAAATEELNELRQKLSTPPVGTGSANRQLSIQRCRPTSLTLPGLGALLKVQSAHQSLPSWHNVFSGGFGDLLSAPPPVPPPPPPAVQTSSTPATAGFALEAGALRRHGSLVEFPIASSSTPNIFASAVTGQLTTRGQFAEREPQPNRLDAESEIKLLKAEKMRILEDLDSLKTKKMRIEGELDNIEKSREALNEREKSLQNRQTDLIKSQSALREQERVLAEEKKMLDSQREELDRERDDIKREKENMEKNVKTQAERDSAFAEKTKALDILQAEVVRKAVAHDMAMQAVQADLATMTTRSEEAEACVKKEKVDAEKTISNLKQKVTDLTKQIDDLEAKKNELADELDQTCKRNRKRDMARVNKMDEIRTRIVDVLERSNAELHVDVIAAKCVSSLTTLETELSRLRQKMRKKRAISRDPVQCSAFISPTIPQVDRSQFKSPLLDPRVIFGRQKTFAEANTFATSCEGSHSAERRRLSAATVPIKLFEARDISAQLGSEALSAAARSGRDRLKLMSSGLNHGCESAVRDRSVGAAVNDSLDKPPHRIKDEERSSSLGARVPQSASADPQERENVYEWPCRQPHIRRKLALIAAASYRVIPPGTDDAALHAVRSLKKAIPTLYGVEQDACSWGKYFQQHDFEVQYLIEIRMTSGGQLVDATEPSRRDMRFITHRPKRHKLMKALAAMTDEARKSDASHVAIVLLGAGGRLPAPGAPDGASPRYGSRERYLPRESRLSDLFAETPLGSEVAKENGESGSASEFWDTVNRSVFLPTDVVEFNGRQLSPSVTVVPLGQIISALTAMSNQGGNLQKLLITDFTIGRPQNPEGVKWAADAAAENCPARPRFVDVAGLAATHRRALEMAATGMQRRRVVSRSVVTVRLDRREPVQKSGTGKPRLVWLHAHRPGDLSWEWRRQPSDSPNSDCRSQPWRGRFSDAACRVPLDVLMSPRGETEVNREMNAGETNSLPPQHAVMAVVTQEVDP